MGIAVAVLVNKPFGIVGVIVSILVGVIALPILTYRVSGVNRFMLGFLVSSKLLFMLTTVLVKESAMEISTAVAVPLIGGAVIGFILMAWKQMRVSAFVLGCTFIGASGKHIKIGWLCFSRKQMPICFPTQLPILTNWKMVKNLLTSFIMSFHI